jgi:hypothetical protein
MEGKPRSVAASPSAKLDCPANTIQYQPFFENQASNESHRYGNFSPYRFSETTTASFEEIETL